MVRTFSKRNINDKLRQVLSLNLQISTKAEELARWREISEKTSGIIYSHAKSGRGRSSRVEDSVIKIDAIERAIKTDVENLMVLQNKISGVINKINDPVSRSVLSLRYISGMSWERVAEMIDYSYTHTVHRLHPKALDKFNDLYLAEGE